MPVEPRFVREVDKKGLRKNHSIKMMKGGYDDPRQRLIEYMKHSMMVSKVVEMGNDRVDQLID